MTRRRRGLTGEERALWESVARTVAPLRPADVPEPPPAAEAAAAAENSEPAAPKSSKPGKPVAAGPAEAPGSKARHLPPHPPLHPIERRTRTRLARGTIEIDARIDLHGMTQLAAHERLHRFLREAQAGGARIVLVITGKGRPGSEDFGFGEERGVLRRRVPHWLAEPAVRSIVLGFEEAHRGHGGSGALYVRLRRARSRDEGA